MNKILLTLVTIIFCFVSIDAQVVRSKDKPLPKDSMVPYVEGLHGLNDLMVVCMVEGINDISSDSCSETVVEKLKRAGIRAIKSRQGMPHTYPFLLIDVNATIVNNLNSPSYVMFSVMFKTIEAVPWSSGKYMPVATWYTGSYGIWPLIQTLRITEGITSTTDEFIDDWRKANPK